MKIEKISFKDVQNGREFYHDKYGRCIKAIPIKVVFNEWDDVECVVNAWSFDKCEYIRVSGDETVKIKDNIVT